MTNEKRIDERATATVTVSHQEANGTAKPVIGSHRLDEMIERIGDLELPPLGTGE